jgi:hypothetical protein
MKVLAAACRRFAPLRCQVEKATRQMMRRMVEEHRNGTAHWYKNRNDLRISAFFEDYSTYESIADWGVNMSELTPESKRQRLNHGYDEAKAQLELRDVQEAARFRGGECLSMRWDRDLYSTLRWRCALGHGFDAKPYTILKGGHWCPLCAPPPWDWNAEARRNPFFAQVWYTNHDPSEDDFYPEDCTQDIACADEGGGA